MGPQGLQDFPELVLGMRIVLLQLERSRAREAAEDQQHGGGRDDRRESGEHRARGHRLGDGFALGRGRACGDLDLGMDAHSGRKR